MFVMGVCYSDGLTRKGASLLVAAVQFVHGFGTFVTASVGVQHTSKTAYFGVILASAMNMWLALVLCVGVNTGRSSLVLLWLGWAAVILILFVVSVPLIALYAYAVSEHFKGVNFATTFIMFSLSFFLHCFFIHVVYGYYEELILSGRLRGHGDPVEGPIAIVPVLQAPRPNQISTAQRINEHNLRPVKSTHF